jgi:hypothetical protein
MKKWMFWSWVYSPVALAIVCLTLLVAVGCRQKVEKAQIYMPSKIDTLHELRVTWIVQLPGASSYIDDEAKMRALLNAVWVADMNGKTIEEIREAFVTRSADDIVQNGI